MLFVPPAKPRPALRLALTALGAAAVGALSAVFGLPPRAADPPAEAPPPPASLLAADLPVDYEGHSYHGHDDSDDGPAHAEANGRRWPTDRLTYSVDYASARVLRPALSDDAVRGAFKTAWAWWTEALQIEAVEVPHGSAALVPIRFERMDGPSGVLAESYLANGTMSPKSQRYDSSERWTAGPPAPNLLSLPTVACHELGHVLGLAHDGPAAPAVMRPVYTAQLPREQPRDVDRMVNELGYKRRPPPPPPGAGGTAQVLSFPVTAKAADLADALKKAGWSVGPPQ